MKASIDLEVDGEAVHLEGFCNSGPTMLLVGSAPFVEGRADTSIALFFDGPKASTADGIDWNFTDDHGRNAFVNDATVTELAPDGMSGSATGTGLLYEDSTTATRPLVIEWTCASRTKVHGA